MTHLPLNVLQAPADAAAAPAAPMNANRSDMAQPDHATRAEHPSVRRYRERDAAADSSAAAQNAAAPPAALDADELRQLCLAAGAADVGFVEIERPALADQHADIIKHFPPTKALISIVCRMNREPILEPSRAPANLEFHQTTDETNAVARNIVTALAGRGVRALNPASGFPMNMTAFPGKVWIVSHKPVAVAAGLGQMGIHRNVIHPRFGNFIILGTVLLDRPVSRYGAPLDYNPCLSCKLCVAACPVGAISPEGDFNVSACMTHNYREFMGGFTDWVESIADSRDGLDYRRRVSDTETASMWQSLAFGPNYKAAYCLAVCPAGDEVLPPFIDDRAAYVKNTLRPLVEKPETIYVVKGSDAEEHVARRFPAKRVKRVHNGLRPRSIAAFLRGARFTFQPGRSAGLRAVYHFTFRGAEPCTATMTIAEQKLTVEDGHVGEADLHILADSATWLGFLAGERGLLWALLRRRISLRGPATLLVKFGRCFPR